MYTPSVYNESCHQIATSYGVRDHAFTIAPYDLARCFVVVLVTFGLVLGNLSLALAVNSKYCVNILQFQTRCLLTSIATNNVATGILVTIWNAYPAMVSCWPYGILLCQIQAVLRGSLSQHNSILWILIALDRYIYATRKLRYLRLSSSKHCVWVVGLTWSLSFTYYTSLVLPYSAFDYLNNGLAGCEPIPQPGFLMLISTCLLYFPTTMILLYVYGTVFHSNINPAGSSSHRVPVTSKTVGCNHHCTASYCNTQVEESVTRTVATLSLAFIINSTPWIIKQIIVACLANEVAAWLDFCLTWSSISLGVWNPFLCWLLCRPIREGLRHVLSKWCCCQTSNYSIGPSVSNAAARRSSTYQTELSNGFPASCEVHQNPPNNTPVSTPPSPSATSDLVTEQGERIWGEILERSLSTNSIHRSQGLHPSGYHGNCRGNQPTDPSRSQRMAKRNNGELGWNM